MKILKEGPKQTNEKMEGKKWKKGDGKIKKINKNEK